LAAAETNVNSSANNNLNKLSFDFAGKVTDFVKNTSDAVTNVFKTATATAPISEEVDEIAFSKEEESKEAKNNDKRGVKDLNTCEVYDATFLNTVDLDVTSTKAVERIEKIEETIDNEAELRAEIFEKDGEKNKKLTEFQKKEKIVFREMRKELDAAKKFYKQIDQLVVDTVIVLEETDCENIGKKQEKVLQASYVETEGFVTEESVFRKTFLSSLKDKMSILQTSVKDAKSGVKEGGK
jgi:hypothetical protein